MQKPYTFIFTGRSGCGKGTQSKMLMDYLKKKDSSRPIFYVETGDHFRQFIKGNSYSSKLASAVNEKDQRQPDFLAVWIWSNLFIKNLKGDEHIFIDGAPRSIWEAEMLDTAFKFYNRSASVIYLDVNREWSQKKLLERGRLDDANLTRINRRLDWYEADVIHAVDFFRDKKDYNFISIKGERPIEEIHQEIISKVFSK